MKFPKIQNMLFVLLSTLLTFQANAQLEVAITIDDVPNGTTFGKETYASRLLTKLDSIKIPIAIFINEGKIQKTQDPEKSSKLLDEWAKRDYITLGNHSYSHSSYSEIGFDKFTEDVIKGEDRTRSLAKINRKELRYFRFPYNDLGNDSIQHHQMREFLKLNKYQITPFTVESSDWMYNYVYEYALSIGDFEKAKGIGEEYVLKTLEAFAYCEELSTQLYKRPIRQIYLCHDNAINADFLPKIVTLLKEREYKFISLESALKDKLYQQPDNYYNKWGISWLYRWMKEGEREKKMQSGPDTSAIKNWYNDVQKKSGKKIVD